MIPPRSKVVAALLAFLPIFANAHEGKDHSEKSGPVRKEQKEWGIAGDAKAVKRTIKMKMSDMMRFTPDQLNVNEGDTIKFVFENDGKIMHEFVLGTKQQLDEHAAVMTRFPNMEHDEPYMAHVPPGKVREIVWTFNRAGDFDFACLIPGHYQAGMAGKIKVEARSLKGDRHSTHKN